MQKLSVVVLSYNEEAVLGKCLSSVSWAGEIILVDSYSTDRTLEVARRFTSRIYQHPWQGFGKQKNIALEHATGPWVLCLDADESVSPALAREIQEVLAEETPTAGFQIPRLTCYQGRFLRHCWYPDYKVRLFRKDRGRWKDEEVHEIVLLDGPSAKLRHPLFHDSFPTIADHVEIIQRYTTLGAHQLLRRGKGDPFPLHRLLGSPLVMFLKLYVLKRGFLDGLPGFVACVLSGFHEFVKYAKLYELRRLRRARAGAGTDGEGDERSSPG
ncbi:MAG: glycosyltransferase family 2 protein [bacterium]